MLAGFFVDLDWDAWTIWACCKIVMAYPVRGTMQMGRTSGERMGLAVATATRACRQM